MRIQQYGIVVFWGRWILPCAAVALLASGCVGEPETSSGGSISWNGESTTVATTQTTQSQSQPRPTADPPEEFSIEGVSVGPHDVHVGYHAAFSLERTGSAIPGAIVATDLGTGDEVWRWEPDSRARYGMSSDEPLSVLALSRENDAERLQYTGIHTIDGGGTQRPTSVLRTTVLDASTGDVLGRGEAELPAEIADAGVSSNVDAYSVGVRGRYAVSTITSNDILPMTLVTDIRTGSTAWAAPGFLATGLGASTAIGTIPSGSSLDDGTLQAIALDTRNPVWTGGNVRGYTVAVLAPTLVTADVLGDLTMTTTHLYDAATGKELAALDEAATCDYDERDVVACETLDGLVGLDATTAQQLWRLPDEAANRIDPGLDSAFHGRVYANDVILDARTGRDAVPSLPITADTVVPGYAISRANNQAMAYPATT